MVNCLGSTPGVDLSGGILFSFFSFFFFFLLLVADFICQFHNNALYG